MPKLAGNDDAIREIVEFTSRICLNPQFNSLWNELELQYTNIGEPDPKATAFKDAYYAFVQETFESWDIVSGSKILNSMPSRS